MYTIYLDIRFKIKEILRKNLIKIIVFKEHLKKLNINIKNNLQYQKDRRTYSLPSLLHKL